MTRDEAAVCFARLVAHWPRLGGTASDPLAASRAADWILSLTRLTPEIGMAAVDQVIATHREQRLPVFADVQDAARQIARRNALEHGPKAIEAPRSRDVGLAGVAQAKAELARHAASPGHGRPAAR